MPRERLARVLDMLENARRAAELVSGRAREDLDSDVMLALALERAVEVIGEAARFVPEDLRNRYPDIHWRAIAGTPDKLIHGYFSVDHDVLWAIAAVELEGLIVQLERIVIVEGILEGDSGD